MDLQLRNLWIDPGLVQHALHTVVEELLALLGVPRGHDGYPSKYPPAEPGALGCEPLKAACLCRPALLCSPTLRNASPVR